MPPAGPTKRKRIERTTSIDDARRASPHRPSDLDLAKQGQRPSSPGPSRDTTQNAGRDSLKPSRAGRNGQAEGEGDEARRATSGEPVDPSAAQSTRHTPGIAPSNTKSHEASLVSSFQAPWVYLTPDVIAQWSSTGKEQIKAIVADLSSTNNDTNLYTVVQELLQSGLDGRLSRQTVGEYIKDLIAATTIMTTDEASSPVQYAFLDIISVIFPDVKTEIPKVVELREILELTGIDEDVLRAEFDHHLLVQLGLVRSNFDRVFTRKQTSTLYRQANFNLLREESEGFSKLITEIFTTSGNQLPTDDVVEATVDKVRAMIGAFNLDVGRSLDVVLDVFGSVLVKQYRFFVKFLRASPWWPRHQSDSFAPISGLPPWAFTGSENTYNLASQRDRRIQAMEDRDVQFWSQAKKDGLSAFFHLGHSVIPEGEREEAALSTDNEYEQQWIRETGTIPARSNVDAAQLLGFKLSYYHPKAGGGPHDTTSKNLIYLAALLIKIGFVSLHDLYPHLWRDDSEMEALKEQKTKEKAERERAARPGAGARNALLMAGALADDTVSAVPSRLRETGTRASTPNRDAEPEPAPAKDPDVDAPDQKVLLLQSLLAIGALPEALFIIGKFPWLMDLIPEMPDYINRILHHSLSHIYDELRPLQFRSSLQEQRPSPDQVIHGMAVHNLRTDEAPVRKTLRWPLLDKDDSDLDGINYRFYWDEWNDAIPVCRSIDDVFVLSRTLLPLVGAKIGQDPVLVLKLTRIGKHSLRQDPSTENKDRWLDLSKRMFLPSLSLLKPNPGVVNEVFEMLSMFPTNVRYLMYLEWLNGRISKRSDMKTAFDQARAETRDILKRISKTNIRPMARALAKVAYANPHIVITTALNQIESYDSIADVFVEGARYFTDLGYDVLTWALVSSMNKAGRRRVQEDGIFTSKWLTALAHFAGKIYKRYELMKAGPVLQYVSVQIEKGLSTDLIMLEQIISSMGGIAPDNDFNDAQLQAMGGGPILQAQTLLQLLDTRHDSKKSSKRLIRALLDYRLAAKLLIAMAQLRQNCVFAEGGVPLKAIAHIFDEVTRVLGQYLDLLRANMPIDEFGALIPGVVSMMVDYDIPSEIAFWFCRPVLAQKMADFDRDNAESAKDAATRDANADVEMVDEESEEDGEAAEADEIETPAATPADDDIIINGTARDEVQVSRHEKWHPILKDVMDEMQSHVPEQVIDTIGLGFYITFWQLSVYDIFVPSSYSDEIQRQKKKIASTTADRSNITPQAVRARETSIKKMQQLIEDLMAENKQHVNAKKLTTYRLTQESRQWFAGKTRQLTELNVSLMEHCFLPRVLASPLDAYFCYKFLKFMHSSGTPNFHTVGFYDQFFKAERLASLIFTCTSKESDNLGRFVNELLKDLAKWHSKKSVFEGGAHGNPRNQEKLPGFASRLQNGKALKMLEYDGFRTLLYKWHSNLSSALCKCLASPEYMHVRNAISILRVITQAWPAVKHHGETLKSTVEALGKSDREDIKVSSQALLGSLTRRAKQWLSPKAFMGDSDHTTDSAKAETQSQEKSQAQTQTPLNTASSTEVDAEQSASAPAVNGDDKPQDANKSTNQPSSTASATSGRRSPSQGAKPSTPLPARPARDSTPSDRRPRPNDSKPADLPRRLSPPPRHSSSSNLPSRPNDSRNGNRELRPPRPMPNDPLRPDSRPGYPRNDGPGRAHDASYDRPHRYPPTSERTSLVEREDRPNRREHESRPGYEERRHPERDSRTEREHRYEREPPRPPEREFHARSNEREYSRPYPEHSERRRHELPTERRPEPPVSGRNPLIPEPAPTINPQRAALINNVEDSRPGMSIRGQAQDRPLRSSRPTSPRREEDRKQPRPERDERTDRRADGPHRPAAQISSSAVIPRGGPPSVQSRDVRGQGRPSVDMSHGRLEQDPSHRPPPRSERPSEAEPPLGPRSRPSNSAVRNSQGPPPSPHSSHPPQSERLPPSGPGRHTRNNSVPETPAPANPATPSDTAGIHPDRLNHISPTSSEPPRNQRGPPVQTSIPSGPRGTGPPTGPSLPSPISRGPPSGPQNEAPRGRGRDVMNTVNSTLVQAARGPTAPSGRGRGGRQNSGSFTHSSMGPPNSGPGLPTSRDYNNLQQDSSAGSNPNGMPVQPRGPSRQDIVEDGRRPRGPRYDDSPRNDRDDGARQPRREEGGPPPRRDTRGGYGQSPVGPGGPGEEGRPPRKHPRDDGGQQPYGMGVGRGGARVANDAKRPRRGG